MIFYCPMKGSCHSKQPGLWLALFLLVCFSWLQAQTEEKSVASPFPFVYYQLKNGLGVILSEDDTLPIVSIAIAYGVGSLREKPGQAGLAYLLENLMFQGSLNVGPMQHFSYISRVGGRSNAQLSENLTLFFQSVPSHQLPLVLWLESDRMMSLVISEDHLESSKMTVLDEIRRRRFNEPFLDSFLLFDQMIYPDFSRQHPVTGYEEDNQGLRAEEVREFYRTYYVPSNAVLCLVGDFNRKRAKELIEKYFESIPGGKEVPPLAEVPSGFKGPLSRVSVDPLASAPAVHLAYRLTSPNSADYPIFKIIDYLLTKGKSSWLVRRLLQREKIAVRFEGGIETRLGVTWLRLFIVANNEVMVERCLRAVEAEISRLKTALVPEEELGLAKTKYLADLRLRFTSTLDRAIFLAENYFSLSSLEEIAQIIEKPLKTQASDIVGLANRYFIDDNRAILKVRIK